MKRSVMMTWLPLASLVAFVPVGIAATTVIAPHAGIVDRIYAPSGGTGGLSVLSSACGSTGVMAPIVGSVFWNVTIRTASTLCYGSGSGTHNEAVHAYSNGYSFRVWYFNKSSGSFDRTCDRCALGTVGGTGNVTRPQTRLQLDQYGTLVPWNVVVADGQSVAAGTTVGNFPLY